MWIQVVKSDGVDLAANSDSSGSQSVDTRSVNNHAISDALECLLHIVGASKEGHAVAIQSGGLSTAARVLNVSSRSPRLVPVRTL